jgi:D-mannonate dehydratase
VRKIAVNRCYGGFSLSEEARKLLGAEYSHWFGERDDPRLIEVIEQLGVEKASGALADIEIVEIPDDVEWQIEEYDGKEWVAEKNRAW